MFLEVNNTAVALPLGNSSTKDSSNWMNQYKQSLNRKLNKKLCIEGDIGETEIQSLQPLDALLGPEAVLAFWKSKEFDFPILSAMAKDYLTVQASSLPAERAFSSGVDLVTPDRCRMSGKTIEMTQFLKFNITD